MGAPSTVWAPPPEAAGQAWRAWVASAIRRAFLPPGGRLLDLSALLTAGPDDPDDRDDAGPVDAGQTASTAATGRGVIPFWATLLDDETHSVLEPTWAESSGRFGHPAPSSAPTALPTALPGAGSDGRAAADLVVFDLGAAGVDDRLGVLAARALRGGGILAVLTHSRPPSGDGGHSRHAQHDGDGGVVGLVDPTGTVVASAQNADLLYLQHIVIPTRPLTPPTAELHQRTAALEPLAAGAGGAAGRRHVIEHVDLLVFARPRGLSSTAAPDPAYLDPAGTGSRGDLVSSGSVEASP